MIDRDRRMNAEVVGCIITGMSELNRDDSSSDDKSMPILHSCASSVWSSENGTGSYDDDNM